MWGLVKVQLVGAVNPLSAVQVLRLVCQDRLHLALRGEWLDSVPAKVHLGQVLLPAVIVLL